MIRSPSAPWAKVTDPVSAEHHDDMASDIPDGLHDLALISANLARLLNVLQ